MRNGRLEACCIAAWLLPVACLVLLSACARSPERTTLDESLTASRLTPAELRYVSTRVASGTQRYFYRTYRRDTPNESYRAVRGGAFEGVLLLRRPNGLRAFEDGTLTDGRFNLIALDVVGDGNPDTATLLTVATPDGSRLVGVAPDGRGGALSMAILSTEEALTVFLARELLELLPCLEQRLDGSIADLADCASTGQDGGDSGGGGGFGGQVGGALDLLGEPDCGRNAPGRVGFVIPGRPPRRTGARRVREIERELQWVVDYKDTVLSDDPEGQRVYQDLANALAIERRANQRLAEAEAAANREYTGTFPTREERQAQQRAERRVQARQAEVRAAEQNRQDKEQAVEEYEEQRRGEGGGSSQPVPGEQARGEDPRCQGRRVDAARGTLFTNPDFCDGDDLLTCLRREQDSIFGFTEGRCWTETGPDDRKIIVCRDSADDPDDLGAGPGVTPDDRCADGSLDCWTDPNAPRTSTGSIELRYIDMTPLGGILIGLCAAGGCPQT